MGGGGIYEEGGQAGRSLLLFVCFHPRNLSALSRSPHITPRGFPCKGSQCLPGQKLGFCLNQIGIAPAASWVSLCSPSLGHGLGMPPSPTNLVRVEEGLGQIYPFASLVAKGDSKGWNEGTDPCLATLSRETPLFPQGWSRQIHRKGGNQRKQKMPSLAGRGGGGSREGKVALKKARGHIH